MMKYQQLLDLQVFTMQDVYDKIGNINTSKKLINKMLLDKNIKKVKHNLYVVCDLQYKQPIPNQYMIASKIKEDSYICYHSAMEFHGVKNQIFYTVYVASNKRFNDFQFEGYLYSHINSKFSFGIERKDNVNVTDKERTILDCINNTELAGGNEELFLCLELMQKIDNDRMIKYLKQFNSKSLYIKTGFLLETLKNRLGTNDELLKECKKHVSTSKFYFNNETKRTNNKFIREWNLIVPEIFLTRGGTLFW